MTRYSFKLPDIGEGVVEAEIVEWHAAVGDPVAQDAPLVDVMTDKATVEITSPVSGKLAAIGGDPGDVLAVGSELAAFDTEHAKQLGNAELPKAAKEPVPTAASVAVEATDGLSPTRPSVAGTRRSDRSVHVLAAPSVRRRAYEAGLELSALRGSGPAGRVLHADLDQHVEQSTSVRMGERSQRIGTTEIRVRGLRRRIAERMTAAKRHIPHFSYVEEIDVTEVEDLRRQLNSRFENERGHLTFLPFLITAMGAALAVWPECNATYDEDAAVITQHSAVHVGIGTQTPQGLVVPVLRHAESLSLWECAREVRRLGDDARAGALAGNELAGSTITVTSLGPLGGISTTPILNRPEVAIVGVNRMIERPVVRHGRIEVRKMMNLSSSFDHRVVDGFSAASLIQRIKGNLECPATLFIE